MTPQDYRDAGYIEVSANISAALIMRAEKEIIQAYISPILPNYSATDNDIKAAIMVLAVLRVQQISIFATRTGSKEKTAASSTSATWQQVLAQYAMTADMYLKVLTTKTGAIKGAKIKDICGIYFTTGYFFN